MKNVHGGRMTHFYRRERQCGCPFAAIVSAVVAGAGMGLWIHYSTLAWSRTNTIFDSLGVDIPQQVPDLKGGFIASIITYGVAVLILLLLALHRQMLKRRLFARGPRTAYLTANSVANFIFWIVVAFIVLMVAAYACWGLATYGVYQASKPTYTVAGKTQNLAKSLYDDFTEVTALYESLRSTLPASFTSQADPLVAKVTIRACPIYCLDLNGYHWVKGNTCYCDPAIIKNAGQASKKATDAIVRAVVGLLLMYSAGSWFLMLTASDFTSVRKDKAFSVKEEGSALNVAQVNKRPILSPTNADYQYHPNNNYQTDRPSPV